MTQTPDATPGTTDSTLHAQERADQELVMFLERDQLDADTSVPVPRALLGGRAKAGLWALRVFVILVPGAPLLSIALNANVLATVLLPMALIFLIMLANDQQLMGEWTNKPSTNRIAITIVAFISICAVSGAAAISSVRAAASRAALACSVATSTCRTCAT